VASTLVVGGVLVGAGFGGVPADAWSLGDGMAWLASSVTGQVVLLDGTTGRLASRVDGLGAGTLDTAIDGADALVVNADQQALFRVDGATQSLARLGADGEPGVRFEGARRVLVAGDVAYVVQPSRQRVQPVDPETLRPLGDPVTFVGSDFDAAADGNGLLWLLDREVGRLQAVERSRLLLTVDLGWENHDASVVLVDGTPVVVDRTSGEVAAVAPGDGRLDERTECPWFRAGDSGVRVAGSSARGPSWLTLAVPGAGSVLVEPLGSTRCPAPISVADPGAEFGVPVSTDGLVYVPVISTGRVVVVDPEQGAAIAEAQVVDEPGTAFELLVDDGLVFFNAPFSHEAGTVAPDATVTRIDKSAAQGGGGGEGDDGAGDTSEGDGETACRVSTQQAAPGEAVGFTLDDDTPFAVVQFRFGDGSEATGQTAEHAYAGPGRFEPSVTIAGVTSPCPPITVGDGPKPRIEGPSQVQAGQTVTYRDVSEGEITARRWNLPGGTPPSADAAEVEVRFDTPGSLVIELTVEGPTGTATARARIEVTTQAPSGGPSGPGNRPAPPGTPGTPGGPPAPPALPSPTTPGPRPTTPDPPPTTPDCQAPAVTLTGSTQSVQEGGSVQFDVAFGQGPATCAEVSTEWLVDGTTAAVGPASYTHVFPAAGTFAVGARITYRTTVGSDAVVLPTPATWSVTVQPTPLTAAFLGTWLETGTGRLDITERTPSTLDVHVFGDCVPTACDSGVQLATIVGPRVATMDYDDGVAHRVVTVQVDAGGQVMDTSWNSTYPSGDARGVNCWTQRYRVGAAGDAAVLDHDCDGIPEVVDNCPGPFEGDNAATFNPDQADGDGDGVGDVCDP
jgi:hypothetical protein